MAEERAVAGYAAIAAAEGNGATLLFRAAYGTTAATCRRCSTRARRCSHTRKGGMRVEMEQRIREACDRGMRAIILRAGDFFGGGSGSWFDLVIAKDIGRGRLNLSRAARHRARVGLFCPISGDLVRLVEQRASFSACETLGFPGHTVTGQEFIATIEAVTKSKFTLRR